MAGKEQNIEDGRWKMENLSGDLSGKFLSGYD